MSLKFDLTQEEKYEQSIYPSDMTVLRRTLIICIIIYAAYGLVDTWLYNIGELPRETWISFLNIRFIAVIPFFIINYIWTFHVSFKYLHESVTTIVYMIAGLGIAAMLAMAPNNFSYYGGMFLIFAVGYFLTHLTYGYVTAASIIIIIFYNFMLISRGHSLQRGLIYSTFYIGFLIVCIYASYRSEKYRRENYLNTSQLLGDKNILKVHLDERLEQLRDANRITIVAMAKLVETKDRQTVNNLEGFGYLSLSFAKAIPEKYFLEEHVDKLFVLETIEFSSVLHDIGKIGIPEHILSKPSALTAAEMEVIKTHASLGSEVLNQVQESVSSNNIINQGIDVCRYHHEKWDGSGYPRGLKGKEIPIVARLVAIVDVYDALTRNRPYRDAVSEMEALEIMSNECQGQFDPYLFDIFLNMMK